MKIEELAKKADDVFAKGEASSVEMLNTIMASHKDVKQPEVLNTQLVALWRLAFSIGKEAGTIEGYLMHMNGKPFGQVAHLN